MRKEILNGVGRFCIKPILDNKWYPSALEVKTQRI
jgi:hypothetical protein